MDILQRLSSLFIGTGFGLFSIIPNTSPVGQLSQAIHLNAIGFCASVAMICGGVYGATMGNYKLLKIGLIMQVYVFIPIHHWVTL
jgi:hypothetical protein